MPRSLRAQVALAVGFALLAAVLAWWCIAVQHMPATTWAARVLMGFGAWTVANWAWQAVRDTRRAIRQRRR